MLDDDLHAKLSGALGNLRQTIDQMLPDLVLVDQVARMRRGNLDALGAHGSGKLRALDQIVHRIAALGGKTRAHVVRIAQNLRHEHRNFQTVLLFPAVEIGNCLLVHVVVIRMRTTTPDLDALKAVVMGDLEAVFQREAFEKQGQKRQFHRKTS